MPELPEVNALVEFLDREMAGAVVAGRRARIVLGAQDLRSADRVAGGPDGHGSGPARQVHRHRRRRDPRRGAPGQGGVAALVDELLRRPDQDGQRTTGRAPAHRSRRRSARGLRRHGGRHPQGAGHVRGARPHGRPGHRCAGTRPAGRWLRPASTAGTPHADQATDPRPEDHRGRRQRLQRRDPARRQALAVRSGRHAARSTRSIGSSSRCSRCSARPSTRPAASRRPS